MKETKKLRVSLIASAAVLVLTLLSGCAEYLQFTNTVPSEYNLSGVSKIAVLGFNSLPDDPVIGVYSVDNDTKKIVEDMVSTVLFKGKTYKVANMDVEKVISDSRSVGRIQLAQRFDAILYGRVWWKTSGEYKNIQPVVYNLGKWRYERYMSGRYSNGAPIYSTAKLTESLTDVLVEHKYRSASATLMLSLTLYRLNRNGKIEKIVEDLAVADQQFLCINGKFVTMYSPHDANKTSMVELINQQSEDKDAKKDAERRETAGYINVNENATAIPTPLQTKLMLGKKISDALGRKMTPSEIKVEVKRDFSIDKHLREAMRNGRFEEVKRALVTSIRQELGYKVADRIGSLSAYERETVAVAPDSEYFSLYANAKTEVERIKFKKKIEDLIEDSIDDFEDELYALAICEEATRQYEYALETYRCLMKVSAEEKYARGISRCLISLDMGKKLQKTTREVKDATKKSSLN